MVISLKIIFGLTVSSNSNNFSTDIFDPIDVPLIDTLNLDQSGPGSNGNEEVINTLLSGL